jgi:hypothetical protein
MAYDFDKPLLTLAQIKTWQERKLQLEREVRARQEEMAGINRKLEAAKEFVIETPDGSTAEDLFKSLTAPQKPSEDGLIPMTEAVEQILTESPRPMNRKELKNALMKLGYAPKRLGNYFYTVLLRLQQQNRITRNGDMFAAAFKRYAAVQNDEAPSVAD